MDSGLTLAIETSNPSIEAGVAIGSRERGLLGVEVVRAADGRHDDLITAIDRLARRLGIGARDLNRVAVSIGPGGYTTLRIAIATTKMLCETLRAACVPIPTAHVVARRVTLPSPFAVVLASKDETAFVTVFDGPEQARDGGVLIHTLADIDVRAMIADRFLPSSLALEARDRGIAIHEPRFDAGACLELSYVAPAVDPLMLAPIYPREAEAVTKWRQRHGR